MQESAHIYLGIALAKQKKLDAAAVHYRAALSINPESAIARNNLAKVLHTQGKLDEAVEHYRAALKADPNLAEAHNNLGILLLQRGRSEESASELREALRLNPENGETQYNLALALNAQRKWSEAAKLLAKTVVAQTKDPKAHYEFARALAHGGKTKEALSEYASALLIQPDFPDALDCISWVLATSADAHFRNGTEAVRMADRASELTGRRDPEKLKTLAAAYAEAGRFPEAISTAQTAVGLAAAAGRQELAEICGRMAKSFGSGRAWREPVSE
jgi:tetratricopeptide (TPR) repeat protein